MADYYRFESQPGVSQRNAIAKGHEYLDDNDIVSRLIDFSEGGVSKVTFYIPQIHCSSCLWLLEHLDRLDHGVTKSVVNFSTKKATITYRDSVTSLRRIVELLAHIGYEPEMNFDHLEGSRPKTSYDRKLIMKLAVAGFCFGNIMLLSFPEYLGFDKASYLFKIGYINILLAIPVLLYSGIDYIISAYKGIRVRDFNIDVPIALGMLALFGRSLYEISGHHGEGYFDSFAGFVFFLLIGRWFQAYTYLSLDFDRSYKSYFPISTNVVSEHGMISKSIDHLQLGDILRIRNQELIPTDGILHKGNARIDYSFVTGESDLISKRKGDRLYAGGRHQGESIDVLVAKLVDQSYLTQLWNEDTFNQTVVSKSTLLLAKVSKYFTFVVVGIAIATMLYWLSVSVGMAFNTFAAVLIVACPCALALAIPFAYGNILRLLAVDGVFLRNVQTIEQIQDVDCIIFDKTGTITDTRRMEVSYHGRVLTAYERTMIKSACSHSSHPLSIAIVNHLASDDVIDVEQYQDIVGSGLQAKVAGHVIKIGSTAFIFGAEQKKRQHGVFVQLDGKYLGYFNFKNAFRVGTRDVISNLSQKYTVTVLSGDTDHESARIAELFGHDSQAYFNQSPKDKLEKVKILQSRGHKVMMIGDGLNDAGALKQANVGLVIADDTNNFSPACDAIIDASQFEHLHQYLEYIHKAKFIIYGAFILALLYNFAGLSFAVTGRLSPVIAAILMPLSSITVIVYGVVASWLMYRRK